MSAWRVVDIERSWKGDPAMSSKDTAYGPSHDCEVVPGTDRPSEITYTLKLEKWTDTPDSYGMIELLEKSQATVTVRYVDHENGVTCGIIDCAMVEGKPNCGHLPMIIEYLRSHSPALMWDQP